MEQLFYMFFEASIFGAVIIVLIMLLRPLLKNAPRRAVCVLWMLAALRLLLPISVESTFSLQPDGLADRATMVIVGEKTDSLSPQNMQTAPPATGSAQLPGAHKPANDKVSAGQLVAAVWLTAAGAMCTYAFGSYVWLRLKVREATKCNDGVMESERVQGAFLLGYIKPKIYLPVGISEVDRAYILAHERTHIAFGDNWWKLLGYLCVCIHWYNPVVWLGYGLFCRDIEVACDERVVQGMNLEGRKAYSTALLNTGRYGTGILSFPVTFGEVSLKQRIKSILAYRKPVLWITVAAVFLIFAVAVCFLTVPEKPQPMRPEETEPSAVPHITEAPTDSPTDAPTEAPTELTTETPIKIPTEPPTEAPTTPPVTNPPATNPPTTNPPTEPPVINSNDPYDYYGTVPTDIRGKDYAPAENTPEHVHSYTSVVYGPFCTLVGYTEHRCSCSHVYYDGFTNAVGHTWEFQWEREATGANDGGIQYRCAVCWELKMENYQPAKYKTYDMEAVDREATQYAATYGFQTFEKGANSTAESFSVAEFADMVERCGGQAYLLQTAKKLVDDAYAYCQKYGYEVPAAGVWIELVYIQHSQTLKVTVYCATAG